MYECVHLLTMYSYATEQPLHCSVPCILKIQTTVLTIIEILVFFFPRLRVASGDTDQSKYSITQENVWYFQLHVDQGGHESSERNFLSV